MTDYIKRGDAIMAVREFFWEGLHPTMDRDKAENLLFDIPAADVRPVVHARWVDNGIPDSMLSGCSACGYTCGAYSMRFCPNCGADMREVDNDS